MIKEKKNSFLIMTLLQLVVLIYFNVCPIYGREIEDTLGEGKENYIEESFEVEETEPIHEIGGSMEIEDWEEKEETSPILEGESKEIESSKESEEETKTIKAEELDLGDYSTTMIVGEKQLLTVTILPYDATETSVTYSSSNETVATINGMGRITAVSIGSTTITVVCGEIKEQFKLEVKEEETESVISVTDIQVSGFEDTVEVDKSITASATVLPVDATEQTIFYESSNPQVATVNQSGEIRGISVGKAVITIKAGNFSKKQEITVKKGTASIQLNTTYLILKKEEIFQLQAEVFPVEANQNVTYKSLDTNIVEVSSTGQVVAKNIGNTTIVVSNEDMSNAVTVIVNGTEKQVDDENVGYVETVDVSSDYKKFMELFQGKEMVEINVEDYPILDKDMLKYLRERNKTMNILGDGYKIIIKGENIVNYDNEFHTELNAKEEKGALTFLLNNGKNLPGIVSVIVENENDLKYIYLYNEEKGKYEKLNIDPKSEMNLDIAGEYKMMNHKIVEYKVQIISVAIFIVLGIAGCTIYVLTKKKYWFW